MALDFGKLNFSISFNPTSAFPLDARSYFESYLEAEKAAASAAFAGSTDSVYYYGQTLVVVENNKATFYIIQPDNTLSAVTGAESIPVNPKLFEVDNNGNLSLKGFDEAVVGDVFSVGEDGTLRWIDIYTKEDIDQKIAAAVANAAHLKRKIVQSIEEIERYVENNADAEQYIFMIPTGLEEDSNKYYEYMVVTIVDSEGIETQIIEKVGSWEVDLSNYATKEELEDLSKVVDAKVDKVEGSRLITNEEANKVNALANIHTVNETSFKVESNKLSLLDIPVSKVVNLADILNRGSATEGGYYLVTKTDKDKLDALVIGDEGLEISGTVNAYNVQQLDEWITSHINLVTGLSEENFTTELHNKLTNIQEGAEKNYIKSVSSDFTVTTEGQLNIKTIAVSKVSNLQALLDAKANKDMVESLADDVSGLKERLTWIAFI